MKNTFSLSALVLAMAFSLPGLTAAQTVAGSTTTGVSIVETTQVALGWSVKKALLGKTVYNEAGRRVGKVQDIIIAPDQSLSFIIVGAGGFIGLGRHDVAVPVSQIKDQAGKLVMAGATVEQIKAMPQFDYANEHAERNAFVAAAAKDITRGNAKLFDLQRKAGSAAAETKVRIDQQIAALQLDVTAAEASLAELNQATASRWKELQASVSADIARLRKSIASSQG
jgi:sporulation protein YlmC with PRC-barrel domain